MDQEQDNVLEQIKEKCRNIMDELKEYVHGCKKVPFSDGRVIVELSEMLEILEHAQYRIESIFPAELEKAQRVLADKDNILDEAQKAADEIEDKAIREAERLLNEQRIVIEARKEADDIMTSAQEERIALLEAAHREAEELRNDADQYAYNLMNHLEVVMKRALANVQQGKDELNIEDEH